MAFREFQVKSAPRYCHSQVAEPGGPGVLESWQEKCEGSHTLQKTCSQVHVILVCRVSKGCDFRGWRGRERRSSEGIHRADLWPGPSWESSSQSRATSIGEAWGAPLEGEFHLLDRQSPKVSVSRATDVWAGLRF